MNQFIISQENLQKLADYLVTRPWAEANPFIQILTTLKVVEPKVEAKEPTLQVVPDKE